MNPTEYNLFHFILPGWQGGAEVEVASREASDNCQRTGTYTQLIKLCLNGFFVPLSGSSFWFVFCSWITLSVCAVWASQGSPCTSAARVRQLSSMLEWHKEQNLLNLLNWFVCKTLVFFFLNWFSLFCPS